MTVLPPPHSYGITVMTRNIDDCAPTDGQFINSWQLFAYVKSVWVKDKVKSNWKVVSSHAKLGLTFACESGLTGICGHFKMAATGNRIVISN
jgi:hypothetical protein